MLILLIVGLVVLAALILRFVLPEMIYGLRQEIVKVKTNKAFLDRIEGRKVSKPRFTNLLMKDFRYESSDRTESYALGRITKIRELYFVLDSAKWRKRRWFRRRRHEVCIIELANLLGNLARQLTSTVEETHSIVDAHDILSFVANNRRSEGDSPISKHKDVVDWFHENPMSIEQASEIVIAAVFGLAYRQQVEALDVDSKRSVLHSGIVRRREPIIVEPASADPILTLGPRLTAPATVEQTSADQILTSALEPPTELGGLTSLGHDPAASPIIRDKVFISYSHRDSQWLERLRPHLRPLERDGSVKIWDDTRIRSGAAWREEIESAIDSTKIALLLISANYLASEFILSDELPTLLAAAEREGTIIMSLIVSPSRFLLTPSLNRFQAVNSPERPLTMMDYTEQEQLFVRITQDIEGVLLTAVHP